jgi:hypothetical protein
MIGPRPEFDTSPPDTRIDQRFSTLCFAKVIAVLFTLLPFGQPKIGRFAG